MKKKHLFIFLFTCVIVLLIGYLKPFHQTNIKRMRIKIPHSEADKIIREQILSGTATTKENNNIPSLAERRMMSPWARIALLEKLGYVPRGSEPHDYILAERTSWWGKRLDPDEFWKGRVIWYDDSAEYAARSRGRAYPPMPYDDPTLFKRSDEDKQAKSGFTMEGTLPRFVSTERENAFWSKFRRTHPNPPEHIQRWLSGSADSWLRLSSKINQNDLQTLIQRDLRNAKNLLFTPECVSPEAYKWDHVLRKRSEYEELIASEKIKIFQKYNGFFKVC